MLSVLPDSDRFRTLAFRPKFEARRRQKNAFPAFREPEQLHQSVNDVVLRHCCFAAYRKNFEVIGVTEGYGKVAVSLL